MATSELSLDTPDGAMPTFQAAPDGEAKGGIVVVQEAFGVTRHIQEVCRRLAAAGWLAVAPALFHRQGSPVLDYNRFDRVMPVMRQLTSDGITDDLAACFGHLDSEGFPAARTGIVGFCMGGSVALVAASQLTLGAAVTYYGGGLREGRFGFSPLIDLAPALLTPWLGHFGDLDKGIPVHDVEALRTAASSAEVPSEVYRYAGADHGFNCDDRPAVFDPEAAALAWERTIAWLDGHVRSA
jgi:carboxymethylenebutenolidase